MANDFTWGKVIGLILIVLVLVIVIFGIVKFRSTGILDDLIPDFLKGERNITYSGDEKISRPNDVVYKLDGKGANNINFYYNKNTVVLGGIPTDEVLGWNWEVLARPQSFKDYLFSEDAFYRDDRYTGWVKVGREGWYLNEYLTKNNQEHIPQLINLNAEEGLKNIVKRVVNDGLSFTILVGAKGDRTILKYKYTDKNLNDLDGLIIRINQILRKKE